MIRYIIIHRRTSPRLNKRYQRSFFEQMHVLEDLQRQQVRQIQQQRQSRYHKRARMEPMLDWQMIQADWKELRKRVQRGWDQFLRIMQKGLAG